jgi:hypothetical protein
MSISMTIRLRLTTASLLKELPVCSDSKVVTGGAWRQIHVRQPGSRTRIYDDLATEQAKSRYRSAALPSPLGWPAVVNALDFLAQF